MAEAVTPDVALPVTPQVPAEATPVAEPSPVEQKARDLGWVPKEEYEGDETHWLEAAEFVRRQPLFEKIDKQNRELKEMKRTMAQFSQHHARVRETEYKRALADLKARKVEAFNEGDAAAIVAIEEKIDAVKDAQKQFEVEQAAQIKQEAEAIHPEFEAWTSRNTWYTADRAMRAYADAYGTELAAKGGKTPQEVLKEVEKKVREEFPRKFSNPNRDRPGAVEGKSAPAAGGRASSDYTPNDFERRVAEKFVKQGLYKNVNEYYKELKLINGKS